MLYGDYTATGPRDYHKGEGAIRAFGDHKGSGLAFMCELLGGSLTGTSAVGTNRPWANGMLSFYVDPNVIDPAGFFPKDVARYAAYVKSSRPITPGVDVLLPGEPELKMRAERSANGVPLPDDTWSAICQAARKTGITDARIATIKVSKD